MRTRPPSLSPSTSHAPPAAATLTPRRILVAYVVLAVAWIALSDRVSALLFPAPEVLSVVQTIKGWIFVATTSFLLAVLLGRYERDREGQRAALAEREQTFRLLAERARDVIFRFRVAPVPRVEYVSPVVESTLGYPVGAFHDDPSLLAGLVHPEDPVIFPIDPATIPETDLVVARLRAADGRWVPFEIHIGRSPVEPDGGVAIEGVARDITDRQRSDQELHRLNRVLRTMSAVNRALVRATTEPDLLATICEAIVTEGQFCFAWVARPDPDTGRMRPVAHAGHEAGYLSSPAAEDAAAVALGPIRRAARERRPVVVADVASDPGMAPWRAAAIERGFASLAAFPLVERQGIAGTIAVYSGEVDAFGPDEVALFEELAADLAFGIRTLREGAALAAGEDERRRLATVVAQSNESIVITDADNNIEYVNPAFERLTGYRRDEVIGRNPRLLKSGAQSPAFYSAMWETLLAGRSWVSDMVNRRADGTLFTEEAVMSPVLDPAGVITGYVAVKRDVTVERAAEAQAQAQARDRALIAEALAAIRPANSPEETAAAICRQVSRLPEAAASWLLVFNTAGDATLLAGIDRDGRPMPFQPMQDNGVERLHGRAETGPWVEAWRLDHERPADEHGAVLPIEHVAYAAVRVDDRVAGLLGVASTDAAGAGRLTERLPALVEFAGIAGAVLGPSLSRRAEAAQTLARIRRVIDDRAFRPVFQPIVDLDHGAIIGVEALTRFSDGSLPDRLFEEAAHAGLGIELELETAAVALEAAASLPADIPLSLNASPGLVTSAGLLGGLLERHAQGREIVIEVTEHEAIADYAAFLEAVAGLGPSVRLAVDDAGAGFASMRHVLELRPAIVKVDRSLVAGIDGDSARQALLAGFRHLADSIGCLLVAEGIETDAELATLRGAGLTLGQGFLLGRPGAIRDLRFAGRSARPTTARAAERGRVAGGVRSAVPDAHDDAPATRGPRRRSR